jgi:hypothetical protein
MSNDRWARWNGLLDALKRSNLPASDKAVYRVLLDAANYETTVLLAKFTPTREQIGRETSLSRSQVGYSTRHLVRHGWLAVQGKTGPNKPRRYGLGIGADCDCTGRVHAPRTVSTDEGNGVNHWHRTVSTNGVNAAGQTASPTEKLSKEKGLESPEIESQPVIDVYRLAAETRITGADLLAKIKANPTPADQLWPYGEDWREWPAGSEGELANANR